MIIQPNRGRPAPQQARTLPPSDAPRPTGAARRGSRAPCRGAACRTPISMQGSECASQPNAGQTPILLAHKTPRPGCQPRLRPFPQQRGPLSPSGLPHWRPPGVGESQKNWGSSPSIQTDPEGVSLRVPQDPEAVPGPAKGRVGSREGRSGVGGKTGRVGGGCWDPGEMDPDKEAEGVRSRRWGSPGTRCTDGTAARRAPSLQPELSRAHSRCRLNAAATESRGSVQESRRSRTLCWLN